MSDRIEDNSSFEEFRNNLKGRKSVKKIASFILLVRKKSLEIFSTQLEKSEWNEPNWQAFFEENPWIFGYGLNYQYLKILQREAHVSGVGLDGKNEVISDFLMGNKFTVLVELKRPDTNLFGNKIERSETWKLSAELHSAVSQILAQKSRVAN